MVADAVAPVRLPAADSLLCVRGIVVRGLLSEEVATIADGVAPPCSRAPEGSALAPAVEVSPADNAPGTLERLTRRALHLGGIGPAHADALIPTSLAAHELDGARAHVEEFGDKLEHRGVCTTVHRRRRDPYS